MKKELFQSRVFLAGAALLVIGASPLLLYILYELVTGSRGGNPIGLGLLFVVSFWPAVILRAIGAVAAACQVKKGGGDPQ